MLGEDQLRDLTQRTLSLSEADQTEVLVFSTSSALTRFANNYIHQNVEQHDVEIRVRAILGKRIGVSGTNATSGDALRAVVERATTIARHQRENPDFQSLPAPAPVSPVDGYVESTASFSPDERAAGVRCICEPATAASLTAAGAFSTTGQEVAVANSLGIFNYHKETVADLQTVVMGPGGNGTGHAARVSGDIATIDASAVADEAIAKALRSRDATGIEPGEYTVILEEYAVADILDYLAYLSFGAQSFVEKRSFMAGKLGERVMGQNVSIWDDGLSPRTIPMPFDFEGVPKRRVDFIDRGIARDVVWDTYYGGKERCESTGHALPAGNTFGPVPMHMFMATGDATKEEMLATTKRGIWVSRFWYTRPAHPLNVIITGMTRDGTFLIEDGKLTKPLHNLRFTQGYVDALNNVEAITREDRLIQGEIGVCRVPALKIAKWNFTGASQ